MNLPSSGVGVKEKLLGRTEARIFTPPLRELTPETSLGFEAIEAARLVGRELYPWQEWFLIHSMELALGSHSWDEIPQFRYKTVLLLVSRQNGKSFIMSTRLLWRMLMWDDLDPAETQKLDDDPTLVLGAAHKLSAAEEILDLTVSAVRASPFAKYIERKSNVNGNKYLQLKNGARYKCEAASDDGGRGLSVTDLAFDELRQQRDWESWSALTNTTNAKPSSQIIAVSNAGEAKSEVLRSLRSQALKRIDDWDEHVVKNGVPVEEFARTHDVTMGIFEWSGREGCDIHSREDWAYANPTLNHEDSRGVVRLTEDMLASTVSLVGSKGADGVPEHVFRTENLCQWVTVQTEGPFSDEQIQVTRDEVSQIDDESPIVLGVDTSHDRSMTYLAVAGYRADGKPHVEVIVQRAGTVWVPDFVGSGLDFTPDAVVLQGRGAPASSLIQYIEDKGVSVTRCEGNDLTSSCSQFADHVSSENVRHIGQEILEMGMRDGVKKPLGEVWVWDRGKSPVDVAPLCAVTLALWGLEMLDIGSKQVKVTAYGDDYGRWW